MSAEATHVIHEIKYDFKVGHIFYVWQRLSFSLSLFFLKKKIIILNTNQLHAMLRFCLRAIFKKTFLTNCLIETSLNYI